MFTGLVQCTGRVEAVEGRGLERRFRLLPHDRMAGLTNGESIAVNGVCLTVESHGSSSFTAYASGETLERTNLGRLRTADAVNLERALALGDRLGGHLVSGHVDTLAEVTSVRAAGQSTLYRLGFSAEWGPLVVSKGSVALDGISLTVNACGSDYLEVNIIPETQRETTVAGWTPGRTVNMETDLIGKYVQSMLAPWLEGLASDAEVDKKSTLTIDFLREHGF